MMDDWFGQPQLGNVSPTTFNNRRINFIQYEIGFYQVFFNDGPNPFDGFSNIEFKVTSTGPTSTTQTATAVALSPFPPATGAIAYGVSTDFVDIVNNATPYYLKIIVS